MAIITLAEAKMHLRVTQDDEDVLIQKFISAAEDLIKKYCNIVMLPPVASIQAAALLIVADLYENREASSEKELKQNPTVDRLLFPYRRNMGI